MRFNVKQVLITGRSGGAKLFSAWMLCALTSLAAIAALPAPAGAQVLYGAGPAPNADPSEAQPSYLYQIDPATAQVRQIGSIGFPYVRGMDVDPTTGVIYATAFRPTGGVSGEIVLLTINPTTGQGTEVMSWGTSNGGGNSKIAFRRSDGRVFVGWGSSAFAEAELEDLDLRPVPGVSGINGMTFDFAPDDRLWWFYSEGNLFWRNLETGQSGEPNNVFIECCVDAMSFHPNTGAMWVVTEAGGFRENLAMLDTTTGAVTQIGTFHPAGGALNYHLTIFALAWSEESRGPISLWRGEDDADDSIGHNHGVPENGGTWAAGKIGLAFAFDGVDDRLVIPNHESLEPGSQMTIDAWVYLNSFGHGWPIMQKRPPSNVGGYTFETTHNPDGNRQGLDFVILKASGHVRLSTPADVLQAGVWQHVAATYDGATMRIYVDGVLRAEGPAPAVIDPVNEPVVIGSNVPIPSFTLNGMLDEIQFHRRALSADEVMEIYVSGGIDPEADDDGDGFPNGGDNCALMANQDQTDTDGDGRGDICDLDDDGDSSLDAADNCRLIANPGQADGDADGFGDACEGAQVLYAAGTPPNDSAGTSYLYRIDPVTAQVTEVGPIGFSNVRGLDVDPVSGALYGTAFRPVDAFNGEFVLLTIDPATGHGTEVMSWAAGANNPESSIAIRPSGAIYVGWAGREFAIVEEGDLVGVPGLERFNADVFDIAADGKLWKIFSEGHIAWFDFVNDVTGSISLCCGVVAEHLKAMSYQPGTGTAFLAGRSERTENKLYTADLTTGELTEIGVLHDVVGTIDYHLDIDALAFARGAVAIIDGDGDGVPDSSDNCVLVANPDQADADGDGQGDACEPPADTDADGIPDASDNCPLISNPDQLDRDGDGLGNACEPPGTLQFSSATYPATEADTRGMLVTVVRVGGDGGKVSVDFTTADGTAVSAQAFDEKLTKTPDKGPAPPEADYTTASGRLTFADGETEKRFRVFIVDDTLLDPNETILVSLSNPRGGAALGSPAAATITIADNDPNVSFAASQSSSEETVRNVDVAVTLSAIGNSPVTVAYSVSGGTAAADDYQLAAGTLTFKAGKAVKGIGSLAETIRLQINNDPRAEPNETIVIELSNPVGAVLGARSRFTHTILANDQPAPDNGGTTPDTAYVLDLAARPRQRVQDSISRSDSDLYRVHLNAGEFLALDVDPIHQSLGSSEMIILDSDGVTALATVGRSAEPDTGKFTNNPAHGFTAPHSGNYYIQLRTNDNFDSPYALQLHRVAVAEPSQDPAVLDEPGPMFVSLNGNILSVTGPSGYGFALIGNWNKSSTTQPKSALVDTTYTMPEGTMITLRSVLGDIPMGAISTPITFRTKPSRWGAVVGELDGAAIPIDVGVPFGSLTGEINNTFGAYYEIMGVPRNWEVRLGESIADTTAFNAVLNGVPYLYFNRHAVADAGFGIVDVTRWSTEILMVVNPVDPSFGVRIDARTVGGQNPPTWHFSTRGFVPFTPNQVPEAPGAIGLTHFYGHVYANWQVELIPEITTLDGSAIVDLDANDDGTIEIDRSHVSDLYAGTLSPNSPVLRDTNIGFNGNLTFRIPGSTLDLKLPKTSIVYNGEQEGMWIRSSLAGVSPWSGTLLDQLETKQEDILEGQAFANGHFFLRLTSHLDLPGGGELHMAFTQEDTGISADVTGTVKWTGSVGIDGVTASCTATAEVGGSIDIDVDGNSVDYAGSVRLKGSVKCFAGGTKVASAGFSVGGEIDGNLIRFKLPLLNTESFRLP